MPVGEDQRQHLELTRNLAQRFNSRFGQTFTGAGAVHPQEHRQDLRPDQPDGEDEQVAARAGSLDLLADLKSSVKKIKSAVTDTEREIRFDEADKPGVSNLLGMLHALHRHPDRRLGSELRG